MLKGFYTGSIAKFGLILRLDGAEIDTTGFSFALKVYADPAGAPVATSTQSPGADVDDDAASGLVYLAIPGGLTPATEYYWDIERTNLVADTRSIFPASPHMVSDLTTDGGILIADEDSVAGDFALSRRVINEVFPHPGDTPVGSALPQYQIWQGDVSDVAAAVYPEVLKSNVADGASAVAFEFDTLNAYATAGAKLATWKNNGVEKTYMAYDGRIVAQELAAAPCYAFSSNVNTGWGMQLGSRPALFYNGSVVYEYTGHHIFTGSVYTTGDYKFSGGSFAVYSGGAFFVQGRDSSTAAGGKLTVRGGTPATGNDGGELALIGGAGVGTNQNGGNITLTGGSGVGTGHAGYILMTNLPTADPLVAGALWNNSGVLTVSAG